MHIIYILVHAYYISTDSAILEILSMLVLKQSN